MNLLNHRFFFNLAAIASLTSIIAGCSDVRILPKTEQEVNVESEGSLCVSEPSEVTAFTKFLFIVDKSGSNAGEGRPGTDPGAKKRAGNIAKFINENANKSYYRYGMIAFYVEGAIGYITEPGTEIPSFTADTGEALQATEYLKSEMDFGQTPYKAALTTARLAIERDIDKNPGERSIYMVFFLSDGSPTDITNDTELDNLVDALVNNQGRPVFLSTAYYGDRGPDAIDRLKRMAEKGSGKFINFENQTDWDFNELIVRPTKEPWLLKNLLVYNANAGFCEDGTVDADSDADGMCDKDELKYPGFDPANRFSFADGYGDYFHWRHVKYGENLPACADRSDKDFDLLTACEEQYIRNDKPSQGVPRSGDPTRPDTDRDGILDGIETFVYFQKTMAFAMDATNLARSQFDGEEEAGIQIAQHRNPLVKDPHQVAYDTRLEPLGVAGKDCYSFQQKILPLYETLEVKPENTLPGLSHSKDENVVYLYYIQTPQSDPAGDGVLKYSFQKLMRDKNNSIFLGPKAGLTVEDAVFKTYALP